MTCCLPHLFREMIIWIKGWIAASWKLFCEAILTSLSFWFFTGTFMPSVLALCLVAVITGFIKGIPIGFDSFNDRNVCNFCLFIYNLKQVNVRVLFINAIVLIDRITHKSNPIFPRIILVNYNVTIQSAGQWLSTIFQFQTLPWLYAWNFIAQLIVKFPQFVTCIFKGAGIVAVNLGNCVNQFSFSISKCFGNNCS